MFIIKPFIFLSRFRNLLWKTTKNDIKGKFAGSLLGGFWLFLYPLLLLGSYALVYLFIFKVKFQIFNSYEYVLLIFCGLIPFIGFSEALSNGVSSVTTNSSLIKNTMFPIELVPVKSVLVSQSTQLTGMGLLLVVLAFMGKWSPWLLFLLVIWLLQVLFSIGVIWILSSVNVYVKDLQSIIGVLVLILMMISPIAYPEDMIPENLRPFLALNPLYYIIVSYQDVLMFGQFPRGNIFWIYLIVSISTFYLGYWFFNKMKRVFVDNV